ncbi:hypothetical protein ACHAW5_006402 [Stephanodiscus triporus]|uniref:LarA-like N-terminal domain-containing protein n=1 Tax=Stephanodiscus triporus TaxID=2934178 RepID=A0ABD3NZ19_9STRA
MKILPALGTHHPMTTDQIRKMFGNDLADADPSPFVVHDWRKDVVTIGHAPAEMVSDATYGMVNEPWPAQLNKLVWEKRIRNRGDDKEDGNENENYRDQHTPPPLVISVGQVV